MKYWRITITAVVVAIFALLLLIYHQFGPSRSSFSQERSLPEPSFARSDREHYESAYSRQSSFLRYRNHRLACRLMQILKQRGWIVVTAESVSAGNLAVALARTPGAGGHFAGGAVCYKLEAKRKLLAIPDQDEAQLYDLQTARDMARGAQRLYQVGAQDRNANAAESYQRQPIVAIATTGRAVSYSGHWEGGVYVGLALPDGRLMAAYFPHNFVTWPQGQDRARTKDEGMLVATNKALAYVLAQLQDKASAK